MIVKMSKVEIAGSRQLLGEALALIQEMGVMQVEQDSLDYVRKEDRQKVISGMADREGAAEKFFLEDLKTKLDDMFASLPDVPGRKSYLEPQPVLESIAELIKRHHETCQGYARKQEELRKERDEIGQYTEFFGALEALFREAKETPDLDFIGLRIKQPEAVEPLRESLWKLTDGEFELQTSALPDGSLVGLITVNVSDSEKVRKALGEERIPELRFYPDFGELTFPEKVVHLRERDGAIRAEMDSISAELEKFATRWGPIYRRVREWIDDRLTILGATTSAFMTGMCFFVYGWIPSDYVSPLKERINKSFGGEVVVTEKEIFEEDLDRVPVILRNPAYFRPFELLTRLLPLPRYSSYDPTTFMGIFFPLFFGMILGDMGYGFFLGAVAFLVIRRSRRPMLVNVAKMLGVGAAYSVIFGFLYGEFFGEQGARLLGFEPFVDRRKAILPMLYFALAIGVFHIALGFFLGFISAFKRGARKEAAYKLLSMAFVLLATMVVVSFFDVFPDIIAGPIIIAALLALPFIVLTGGLLAPFEILKSIGNIISYARIMAIGLTSVLLAYVANRLGGLTGDIALGILIGGLLHALNIAIGVFSPAIHSARLHYVEFFGKFLEHGGRRFAPLKKKS